MSDQGNLIIAAIGTPEIHESTGDGGIGTATGTGAGKTVVIQTPDGERNVTLNLIRPSIAILVRAAWLFMTTLSGAMGADQTGLLPIDIDFRTALVIAGSASGLGALKDAGTVLGELKNKYPLLSGGI